jgi:hypothetical protein
MANLHNTLSEITTTIQSTDKIIFESSLSGTSVINFSNVKFTKDNFEFGSTVAEHTSSIEQLSAQVHTSTLSSISAIETPEILALYYRTSTDETTYVGTVSASVSTIPLTSVHVNNIVTYGDVGGEYSVDISSSDATIYGDGDSIILSRGIYEVDCQGTFTIAGPVSNDSDKAYIVLSLQNSSPPNEILLISTPIVEYAGIGAVSAVSSSNTCVMKGFISVCSNSYVRLIAATAGKFAVGYALSGIPYSNPIHLILRKITDDNLKFSIAAPEMESLDIAISTL